MSSHRKHYGVCRRGNPRRGAAALEFALCLPILVALVVGAMETSNAILLKARLTAAAYEGARTASTPGQTVTAATTAALNVLTQFYIVGGSVAITPQVDATTPKGTPVWVTVSVPINSNWPIPPLIFGTAITGTVVTDISATVYMIHQ